MINLDFMEEESHNKSYLLWKCENKMFWPTNKKLFVEETLKIHPNHKTWWWRLRYVVGKMDLSDYNVITEKIKWLNFQINK